MRELTVKDLLQLCMKECRKGNGDKVIMISDDDEGNGYHYLYYSFQLATELSKPFEYDGKMIDPGKINGLNENVAKEEDTIILG